MRVVAISAFFLLSGIPVVAQYSPQPTTTVPQGAAMVCTQEAQPADREHPSKGHVLMKCAPVLVQGCPIDMRVRQRMGGVMIATDENGVKRSMFVQRLRLFLNDFRPDKTGQNIVSATVTVHGLSGKEHIHLLNAEPARDRESDLVKTLKVDLGNWGETGVSGDFGLPGFTSATRVDLDSITYEDGSTWKLSGNETCRVAPDPLMLVNH